MKKTVIAALLAFSTSAAFSANYYVVVPVPNHTASAGNILVTMSGYTLPAGVYGRVYAGFDFNSVLQVLGDPSYSPADVHWSVAGGTLPAGLSLSANGKLSGTPTAAGTSSFQVMASYKAKAGEQAYQVIVADVAVSLAAAALPDGVQGTAYSYDFKQELQVSGDSAYTPAQVSWALVSGVLPDGVQLNADGTVTGTPTVGGTFPFTVKASYLGKAGQQQYQLVSSAVTVTLKDAVVPTMTAGTAASYDLSPDLQVTGDPAYNGKSGGVSWSVSTGALPAGLALSNGVIVGTPTAVGSNIVGVTAVYKLSRSTANISLTVQANLVNNGTYRAWSDGTYAPSCQAYLTPSSPYVYSGATGDGVYRVSLSGTPTDVYCNQTTNGGGWTLMMKQAQGDATTLGYNTTYFQNGTPLNDTDASLNMSDGNLVSRAFASMPVTQMLLQASNETTVQTTALASAMTPMAAFLQPHTLYSDPPGVPQSTPNWFSHATNYPATYSGGAVPITEARLGFNIQGYYASKSVAQVIVAWGWLMNQDTSDVYAGSDDYASGLGPSKGDPTFQPATLYLWAK